MAQSIVVPSGDRLEFPDGMPDSEIEKAIHAEYPDLAPKPSLMSRAGAALKPAEREPMPSTADTINAGWTNPPEETLSVPGSVMDGMPVSKMPATDPGAIAAQGVPMTREFMNRVRRQMDAAAPEQRTVLASRPDNVGRAATEILRQQQSIDQTASSGEAFTGKTAAIRALDTRKEARSAALARQGLDPQFTQGVATTDAAMGADQTIGGVAPSEMDFELQKPGAKRVWGDWESGVVGSTGATLAYTGRKTGIQALADIGDSMDRWAQGKLPANPTFADQIVNGFGSSGAFLIPGLGVAKGTEALAILSKTAAKWSGAGTMAALEAAAESDGVYKTLIQRGETEDQAMAQADGVFWKNMVLLGVTDKIAFFNDLKAAKTALARFGQQAAVAAPSEGVQEFGQQVISNEATGQPLTEGAGEAAAIGAIVGGVSGGARGAMQVREGAGDRLAGQLYDRVAGGRFDPGQLDAAARQSLDPANAQMRQVGTRAAPVPPQASTRAELAAVLSGNQPVAEILATQAPAAPQTTPQAPLQPAAFGWPDIKTPAVATIPDGQIITGQIAGIQDSDGQPMARFVGADGQVWMLQPGEADIKPAPAGDGTRAAPVQAETSEHVKIAEQAVNTDPSEAQKEAGNYQLGHLAIQGMDIAIENPAGSVRSGVGKDGKPWSNTLNHTYGYIKGATAADGDKLDAFIGPDPQSQQVFVIDQIDPDTGRYDEGKVMLGFASEREAHAAYLSNYSQGWKGVGAITPLSMPAFKAWIAKGATHKPLAYDQKAAIAERKAAADTQKAGEAYAAEREKAVTAIGEDQVSAIEDQVADQNSDQPTIEIYRAIATALKAEAARQATQPAAPAQTPAAPSSMAQPEPVAAAPIAAQPALELPVGQLDETAVAAVLQSGASTGTSSTSSAATPMQLKMRKLAEAKKAKREAAKQGGVNAAQAAEAPLPVVQEEARPGPALPEQVAQPPAVREQLSVEFGGQRYPVGSLQDASEKWEQFRDQAGAGVSDIGNGVPIFDQTGKQVAYVSYNGKVWQGADYDAKAEPVYSPKGQEQIAAPTQDKALTAADTPFDSEAFDKARDDRVKASKAAGNKHLDQVAPSVETMRGKEIYYAHNPQQRGVIRTVDNRGNVYVYWADQYSADKELASETVEDNKAWLKSSKALPYLRTVRDGKTYVFQSSLGTTDLKDYVFGKPAITKPADPETEERAYTKGQAEVLARRMTNQGLPSEAYPHPTQSGMWAIGVPGEEQPTPSTPTAKKEPWQYGELEYGDKYIDEVVLPQLRKDLENAHGGKFQEYKSKAAAVRGLKERIDTLENHRDAKARKYYASLDDHYAAVRRALAAGKDVPPVAYESYDDLKADVSAGRIKGDGQEVARVEQPQHIEAGQAEPATAPVIAASIKESAKNTPMNIEQAREWLLGEIDKAIIDAKSAKEEDVWDRAEGKVDLKGRMDVKETIGYKVFDVPGDGRFSVLNLKESLQKFKKQVAATPGFKKNATRPMSVANGSGGKTSVRDMLEDGEYVLAADYGRLIGEPLLFGAVRKGEAHPIAYTNAEPVDIKGIEAQVGREWNVTGKSFAWRVIETTTGVSVSSETTKERAVNKALAHVDEHGTDKLIAQIKETPKVSQAELERQFTDWGSEEEAKAQKTRDAVERADTEDRALWNSIFPLKDGEKRSPNPWNDIDHMQVVILAKDAAKAGKGDEFVSLIERRRGGTNNMLALAARKALADAAPKAKPAKGSIATGVASKILGDIYQRAAYNKWTWDRLKSYLTREMEASGVGKSRMANALEKAMTEYARTANGRLGYPNSNLVFSAMRDYGLIAEDAAAQAKAEPAKGYPFYSNNKLFNAEGTAELPKDWTGVARSDSGKRFFYLGQENGERSFNPLKAESYEDALKEAEGLKNDKPVIPEGYREVARGYFGGTVEKPIYAPFSEGERVRFIGGHAGQIQSFIGGPVTTGAIIKYDNGLTGRAEWRDVEAVKKPAAEQEPKNFKSIDALNAANNPLGEDDWIRFADGSEWQVKGRMNGWVLMQGKTEHPTVKNIMGQVQLIRAVIEANDAAQKPKEPAFDVDAEGGHSWNVIKAHSEWVKLAKNQWHYRFEGMGQGVVIDTHAEEGRSGENKWRTSDGELHVGLAEAKAHEIETHAKPKLIENGYLNEAAQPKPKTIAEASLGDLLRAAADKADGKAAPEAGKPAATKEPWAMTREEAADQFPGDEYDKMLNRAAVVGDISYDEAHKRSRISSIGRRELWAQTRADLLQEKKDAIKSARGERADINKLKPTAEFAPWRIKSMSATGKAAIESAGKYYDELLAVHRDRVQEAIEDGKDVPAEVLADYPDLATKEPAQGAEKVGDYKIGGYPVSGLGDKALKTVIDKSSNEADKAAASAELERRKVGAGETATAEESSGVAKISDFGEKIGGARKDVWSGYKDKLNDAESVDIKAEPLSKSWPAPDYQALIDAGADPWGVAFARAARDEIPRKPSASWKLKSWVANVALLRGITSKLMNGEISADKAQLLLAEASKTSRGLSDIAGRIELYMLVGHRQSLDGVSISVGQYGVHNGIHYDKPKTIWSVSKEAAASAWSNWPRELAIGDTRKEAMDNFKAAYDKLDITPAPTKAATFDIYIKFGESKYLIGKKVGRNHVDLAGPFDTVKEARAYRTEHEADLAEKLEKFKEIPKLRRDVNQPRVGEDMRGGADVTQTLFAETFGFKGVEFGNWVEQARRQKDLNDAFDALMDMAAVLGVPPKALSLNGELGLAFGARGTGGIDAAAAHYEADKIVINLTKKSGEGSLGHEFFHALDNYFSRKRGKAGDFTTEALDVSLAGRNSPYHSDGLIRKEMIEAFGAVMRAIRSTALKARSSKLDAKRSKEYWTTDREMAARAFESYLISKLHDNNASNDYLSNIVDEATWKAAEAMGFELEESYPYPTAGEVPAIRAGFDHFFKTIETKETDTGIAFNSIESPRPTASLERFYANRTWKSEAEARTQIKHRIVADNEAYPMFSKTDQSLADQLQFVRAKGGEVRIKQAPQSRGIGPQWTDDTPDGSHPNVNWTAKDLADDGTEAGIMREYGRGKGTTYRAWIPEGELPTPKGEDIAAGRLMDDSGGRDELESRGSPPPIKVRIGPRGKVELMDGNHRLAFWRERGYDYVPAIVIDERNSVNESIESDHQAAVSRAIDRAIAIEQGKDVKPLQVLRVRNRIGKLRSDLEAGKISEALFISQVESLHAQMEIAAESRKYAPTNGRARGADFLRQKLLEAKRRGDISEQAADMAEWFILKNPALVEDLGIGIRTPSENQRASGNYNPLNRVMTLFKESASDTTAVHEILHHLERMMPAEMQAEIRKEWLRAVTSELQKATKAGDQKRIAYFEAVLVGNMTRATKLLTGEMGWFSDLAIGQDYQYLNPSEFWAVRMTNTAQARFEAKSIWARSLQWLREALEHIKGALGLKSDHPLLKALDDLIARGNGEFQSKEMLGSSEVYASIEESGPEEVTGTIMRDASLAARLLLHPRQIAANHKPFVPVFDTAIKQFEERDRIVSGLGEMAKPYFDLTHAQRLNVNKIVEQGRLDRTVYTVADLENGIHHAESGDLVTLDAEEIGAYKSLRKTFNEALSLFRDTMLEEFGFAELIPEQKAAMKLRQMIADGEIEESRIEWARHVAKAIDEIEQAKRTGYAPFNRYGQFVVAVKALPAGVEVQDDDGKQLVTGIPEYGDDPMIQIVTDLGGQYDVYRDGWVIDDTRKAVLRALETTLFATKVEVNAFNEWRKQGKDVTTIPEVKAAFDEAKRKYGKAPNARVLAFHITEKAKADDANLSTFDELARISDVDVETWDAVREKLQEAIKAKSFRKHFFGSDNTPGYSVDFERSVADYIIGMSGYLARRKHVKDFDNAIKRIKAPALAKYAEDYRKYVNAPADEFALLKNIGFLYYIAGSTATAAANLTQVPMLTMPTLVQFVPHHIAAREVARAWGETLAMFSPTKTGLQMFDPAKVPADVRDVFKTAWEDQLFVPLETLDLMAASSIKTVGGRKTMRALSVTTQAIAYMFMFAERLNRITTFIAAARISRMKVAKDHMRDVVKNDAWARHSIGGRAWGERNFAEWAVDESQYRMGKVNRPTVMRGVGSPLLQFKGYMIQTLEAGYRMAVMHGKGGKPAALAALAMMLMLGGLWGLPGLEDLREMIERLYKVNTGKDLDLKTEVRQLIARKMGSAALAAAANKGIPYATVGMDMSRVGLGNIIPDSALQVAGIPVDLTIARPMRAAEKMAAGKTTEAMSEFLPNFLKNPAMGLQWKRDGLRDKYGSRMMTPGEFDYADVAIKSLGWTPTKVTNRREYTYAESRAERGIDELKRRYTNDLVRAYVHEAEAKYLAEKAEYKADQAKILAKIEEHNKTASPENLIKLDPGTLRRKAAAEFSGSAAREGKERKLSRGAAQDRRELFQLGR